MTRFICALDLNPQTAYVADMPSVQIIVPQRFADSRGWLAEVFSEPALRQRGITCRFIQDNHSFSIAKHTLRGLHCQILPRAQNKLVQCLRGVIFDVAVDLRKGSPSYGRWSSTELSAENGRQLFIPIGFAHGFLTLEDNCEVVYKSSDTYAPAYERGIRWDDPAIGIDWPMPAGTTPELSVKDAVQPLLADFDSPFSYDGRPLAPLA